MAVNDTTPTGSTTRLVQEKNKAGRGCCGGGAPCWRWLSTLFVVLSLSFSTGNIARLPMSALKNGAGTYLAVYVGISLVLGVPLAFLETVLGQFCQEGPTKLWRAVPILKGVGYVKVLCSLLLAVCYPIIMAISLFYTLWTIKGPLPFFECSSDEAGIDINGTDCLLRTFLKPPNLDPMWIGVVATLLFLIWAFIILCISRGGKSIRMSASILVPLSIACLGTIMYRLFSVSSSGYLKLIQFSVEPLTQFETWYYALIQFYLSSQLGFGNITTYAGSIYSKSNALWTAMVSTLANILVGLSMTAVVFTLATNLDDEPHDIPALSLPILIYNYSVKSRTVLVPCLAYLLIMLAGFASTVAAVYTVVVSLAAETKHQFRSWLLTGAISLGSFTLAILLLLPTRLDAVTVVLERGLGHVVAAVTALQLIGFLWLYGPTALRHDVEFVLGHKLLSLCTLLWTLTPLVIIGMEVASIVLIPLMEPDDPWWTLPAYGGLYIFVWLVIFFTAIVQVSVQVDYNICQKIVSSMKPSRKWGPVDPMYRHGWVQWRDQYQATGERDFTLKRRGTRDYTHSVKAEQRFNTMSLPRTALQVPNRLDMAEHVCWTSTGQHKHQHVHTAT